MAFFARKVWCVTASLVFILATNGAASAAPLVDAGEEIISTIQAMGFGGPSTAKPSGSEAEGPYNTLVIENAMIIDGTGAPTKGPMTVVIKNNIITDIHGAGTGSLHIGELSHGDD